MVCLLTSANTSLKTLPPFCMKPLATNLALYLSTLLATSRLIVKTDLAGISSTPAGSSFRFQVPFAWRDAIYLCIASFHWDAAGDLKLPKTHQALWLVLCVRETCTTLAACVLWLGSVTDHLAGHDSLRCLSLCLALLVMLSLILPPPAPHDLDQSEASEASSALPAPSEHSRLSEALMVGLTSSIMTIHDTTILPSSRSALYAFGFDLGPRNVPA